MEDMYTKLRNKTADNPDGENIIAKKTGIKSMDFIYSGILMILEKIMFIFYIGQVMMVKKYKQNFIRINKLRLHQLNNLNYYNFILRSL